MIQLPNKPRIMLEEPRRDDYSLSLTIRWRRNWRKMTTDERNAVLLDGAAQFEELAAQMRREVEGE